jgi:hypothetical protein
MILRMNFGDVDERSWENVEREAERMLAEGARRVRYGAEGGAGKSDAKNQQPVSTPTTAALELPRFTVTLHRDDDLAAPGGQDLARVEFTSVKASAVVSKSSAKVRARGGGGGERRRTNG